LATPTDGPIPPSKDPWYMCPPSDWESQKPGTILKHRMTPGKIVLRYQGIEFQPPKAYNILYRTTDSNHKPSWAASTVIFPANDDSSKPISAIMSYQHPYDSADVDQSPSYSIYTNALLQQALIGYILKGWVVNIPDYEGPKAAFGAGAQSGHATLDSVRAILGATQIIRNLNRDTKYAMYGYSGGSFATEWAAELQTQYAPELKFSGAGIGGAFPNIANTIQKLSNNEALSGHLRNAIVGIGNENLYAQTVAMSILNKSSWSEVNKTVLDPSSMPFTQLQSFVGQVLQSPAISNILKRDGMMGYHGVPQMPLLVHRHDADQLSDTADTTKLVDEFCSVGANIYYHIN
ncbi:secretory lipase-domain-containing protein, partial [Clohesyomyces aquaticus]